MLCLLQALPVRCGDCLLITILEETAFQPIRILIDTGYSHTYHRTLKPIIQKLIQEQSCIDLLILTHSDSDHIGGIKPLLADFGTNWFRSAWFNYAPKPITLSGPEEPISVKQGISVRDHLLAVKRVNVQPVLKGMQIQLGSATLSVLSPDQAQFDSLLEVWEKEEQLPSPIQPISTNRMDHSQSIEELEQKPFQTDMSWSNRSSIAFIFSFGVIKILFTSDAHADLLLQSLREQGYTPESPLALNLMQVAHHGSRGNTSQELMQYIDCQRFLVSSNGTNRYQFPHKEALARIIQGCRRRRPSESIHFYFTYADPLLRSLFSARECAAYNLMCHFPMNEQHGILVDLLTYE